MTITIPLRLRVKRVRPPRRSPALRRRTGLAVVALTAAGLAVVAPTPPAFAQSGGGTTANLTTVVTIRSLTVSPATVTYGNCSGGSSTTNALGFPNGSCQVGVLTSTTVTGGVTITNTGIAGHIDVTGASMIPSDNGTPWTLCNAASGPACTGTNSTAGPDQYIEDPHGSNGTGGSNAVNLGTTAQCDVGFDAATGTCTATSGQAQNEQLGLYGPSTSTDPSTAWSTTVTWTAVP